MVDGEAFTFLAKGGADFVEVGVGGSPICIFRIQKSIGRGQASAEHDVAATRDASRTRTSAYVPIFSVGGPAQESHLALALGAAFISIWRSSHASSRRPTRDCP
ncbi:IMP dehydrogenase [Streptomyces sp. NPDC093509]|uniref:IMP dehydrogenase n=1 Tax=Streptomyces sp. NPDC093509 TaxID=3154982 RepID=UPI00344CEB33